jgi:hypothetical protein
VDTVTATSAVYTPGDYSARVMSQPAGAQYSALGQRVGVGPVAVPLWGLLAIIAVVLFFERRRIVRGL